MIFPFLPRYLLTLLVFEYIMLYACFQLHDAVLQIALYHGWKAGGSEGIQLLPDKLHNSGLSITLF